MEQQSRSMVKLAEVAMMADTSRNGERGQSTIEFAVVMAGFLALVAALGVLWCFIGGGILVEHALGVASHHIQAVAPTTVADIFLY